MIFFSKIKDYIDVQCEICGKILKVSKEYYEDIEDRYILLKPIKCVCGNKSTEIIK